MELFKAGNESQLKTIYKWIDESDVYMLILGGRYGSVETKSGKSYTQLEYEYALSKNIPVFAVVLSQNFLTSKINSLGLEKIIEQNYPDKYKSFKAVVMSKIIREVDDCKDIKIAIHATLNDFLQKYSFDGWVRSSNGSEESTTYRQLIEDNKLLIEKNKFLIKSNNSLDIEIRNLLNELPNKSESFDDHACHELINLLRNTHIIVSRSHSLFFRHFNVLEYFLKFRNEFCSSTGHKPVSNECCMILKEFHLIKRNITEENRNINDNFNPTYIMSRKGGIFDISLRSKIEKK